jgi:hypothetical protein
VRFPVSTATSFDDAVRQHRTQFRKSVQAIEDAYAESEFAGVLYLVNLALALELYGDFTQPTRPGLEIPLGDFLAVVGERVCGTALRDDPLWDVLAKIAGRKPDDPPDASAVTDQLLATLEARAGACFALTDGSALAFLCLHSGRLALSATRLDVVFPLATHPLAIRMSGLDRNPGWVPAAGRVIELHYV